jgi:hypothetical protein
VSDFIDLKHFIERGGQDLWCLDLYQLELQGLWGP